MDYASQSPASAPPESGADVTQEQMNSLPTLESLQTIKNAESRNLSGFTGKDIMAALKQAYPDKIKSLSFKNNDWAIDLNGVWFYWAQGRLLPEGEQENWERYTAYPFYPYPDKLPPIRSLSEQEKKDLNKRIRDRETRPPSRHPGLYNTLWGVNDRESSWQKVKTTFFLGLKLEIHRELLEDLAAVEEEVQNKMKTDADLRRFVQSIVKIDGYNFRNISGTDALSFHAYGSAIDILPNSFGGKQAYWLWAKTNFPEWYAIPYERRFIPPDSFIRAFENQGFIWGGKWFYFDNIHFEYRPEIHILNGLR